MRADFSYPISYQTPSHVLEQKMVTYDRYSDNLLPLLNTCANQSLAPGQVCPISYDFAQIEGRSENISLSKENKV